jgi:hypothetical protein
MRHKRSYASLVSFPSVSRTKFRARLTLHREPPPLHCTRDERVACLQGDALWAPRLRQTCQSVGASIYDLIKIGIYLIFVKIDRSLLD